MNEEIIRYIELLKYLEAEKTSELKSIGPFIEKIQAMLPGKIRKQLKNIIDIREISVLLTKTLPLKKTYNTFCLNLLNILIHQHGLKILYINEKYFDKAFLSTELYGPSDFAKDRTIADHAAFVLKHKTTNLIFSFDHQGAKALQCLSHHIYSIDNNKFRNLCIILFSDDQKLQKARQANKTDVYKRSFFTSFNEICRQAGKWDRHTYGKIFSHQWEGFKSHKKPVLARTDKIRIINNMPVGGKPFRLYKLTFATEEPLDISPGQFIMISTTAEKDHKRSRTVNSISRVKPDYHNGLQTKPVSFLKRPFGIYQAYYKHFGSDYPSKLHLEKSLTALLYTILPDKFDLVYKVLERGLGTNELAGLRKKDKVEMLAPLGKIFDIRKMAMEEIDEIHVVGGGVGMAPLIYFVQALTCLNLKVKAFIGIESFDSVAYKDSHRKKETRITENANVYIDDLIRMGLSETSDIYVSLLCSTHEDRIRGIRHVFPGSLVTEPYAAYVKRNNHLKIQTFTCGPLPMMQKVHEITEQYGIKSYVLMEKRMACGIGVCFSCICKTLVNGVHHNSRVCIEGPIIESKQINWNE